MDRRQFVVSTAAASATGLLQFNRPATPAPIRNIGVQLFAVPKLLGTDFRGGIAMLSTIGYREVELYGPFPYSAPETIAGWKAVTPQLGFSGSGFFGLSAQEVRSGISTTTRRRPMSSTGSVVDRTVPVHDDRR